MTTAKRTRGKDFNYFNKFSVTATTFGATCDLQIPMPIRVLTFQNEGTLTTHAIEYSFNGNTVHGDMIPTKGSASLIFEDRAVTTIWFRVASGSTGPITVRIEAWAPK